MADAVERARRRAERRLKRKEIEQSPENDNGGQSEKDSSRIHVNGADPDISRQTAEKLDVKSDAALPDVVKIPSGLNENWERPVTPQIDDEGFSRGKNGYKSYSSAVAAQGEKSNLQKRKEQYANTVMTGKRYDSDEEAAFEPEVQSSQTNVSPLRKSSESSVKSDEWSQLPPQKTAEKPSRNVEGGTDFYTEDELSQMDKQSDSSSEKSGKVSDEWRARTNPATARGVNKPKSQLKKSDSWIRERPELPEEPTLEEPPWLDLVRKRRWRSTVKARFPQTERERIQFERRLDTSKKGLKFNRRGEPTGITGPQMDDELSMYLIQQRRRIECDDVVDSGVASASRTSVSSERSLSESDFSDYSFDDDPRNRELAAEKGILNLSRPPIKGPKKEVHKNLAMERSRQSTMKWRFSADPHEDPLWTQLPKPADIEALNDTDARLGVKFWTSKKKFQTGQFDPPRVLPKPSRSSSQLSRSHSSSEVDFGRRWSQGSGSTSEDMTPVASRSAVKAMRQRLASGELLTSTPQPAKPVEMEEGYSPRLRDLQQRLTDQGESEQTRVKPSYVSPEELASMGERKRSINEEMFTEKVETPKPIERPKLSRRRSDAELFDLLASRKEEADQSTIETSHEISSLASDISRAFRESGNEDKSKGMQDKGKGKQSPEAEDVGSTKSGWKTGDYLESKRNISPEFLVKLKDCEVLSGKDVSLEVVVSGEPPPSVQWFLDKRPLTKDDRHVITDHGGMHSLSIQKIQVDDEGIYECVATNPAGSARCDCEILVDD